MFNAQASKRTSRICAQCLRHSRQQSSLANKTSPSPSGAAKLKNRRLISLHGSDAPKFLQGIVTANVRPESRSGFYTAFLTAQGKVLSDTFIYPSLGSQWHRDVNKDEDYGYLVEVDGAQVDGLMRQLKRHKLRSKFKLRLLEEGELEVWNVWKEDERWTAHTDAGSEDGGLGLTDSRAPGLGQRRLFAANTSPDKRTASLDGVPEVPPEDYTIRRYLKGVAEGQAEIPWDDSLPMNCNIDVMGGIDFKKGCYVGQELTIRTHHTGVVRRRILPVVIYEHGQEAPEAQNYDPAWLTIAPENNADIRRYQKSKRPTGKFIAGIGNVGLAMCRLEQMSDLKVSGEGSSFSPEDTFTMESGPGTEVAVKAFVPDWMRSQIREPKLQKRVG